MKIYDRILMLCEEKRINITQMCKSAGVPRGILSDLKMGRKKSASPKTLSKIANYFEVTIDYLIGNEKSPQAERAGDLSLTERERRLIIAFREQPDLQYAVERLLGIEQDGIGQSGQELA